MTGKAESSLETSLTHLGSLAKSLNEASDILSKEISNIESALGSYGLGIWAWASAPLLTEEEQTEPNEKGVSYTLQYETFLGYGKHHGKWGLVVGSSWGGDPDLNVSALRDAPREIRLKAIEKIPELLDVLAKNLARTTEEAIERATKAREIAAALSKKSR